MYLLSDVILLAVRLSPETRTDGGGGLTRRPFGLD